MYQEGSYGGGRRPRFHGFSVESGQVLPHISYPCYKAKFLNIHRAGYEYFEDSSVVFSDIFCFGFAVASPTKKNKKKKKKKMEKMRYLAND